MQSSILKNKLLKNRIDEDRKKYTKQRNIYVSLIRKTKNNYYRNFTERNVTDNNQKKWKVIKPMLSNDSVSSEKITSFENQKILITGNEIAKKLKNFFSNTIKT